MTSIGLLNIGTELLKGRTVNTNAAWLGKNLFSSGLDLNEVVVVHDEEQAIVEALRPLLDRHDVIIITGGLGPTKDDITKKVLLSFFGGEMVLHQPTADRLEEWSRQRNRPMNEPMRQQAMLPSSCTPLYNSIGSAPGMAFRQGEKWIFSLPGIPREMELLMEREVMPRIAQLGTAWLSQQIRLFGKPESEIAREMEPMEGDFPEGLRISWLPTDGEVKIELSLHDGPGKGDALSSVRERLENHFAASFFTRDDKPLAAVLGDELKKKGLSIACAESCTGGGLGAAITSVSGSSSYFRGSIVAYSEAMKHQLLGIPVDLMQAHTVVSAEVAAEMAKAARRILGTDVGLAVTGTAEVVPGDPVYSRAEIFIGWADANGAEARSIHVWQDRGSNTRRAVKSALFMALKRVERYE